MPRKEKGGVNRKRAKPRKVPKNRHLRQPPEADASSSDEAPDIPEDMELGGPRIPAAMSDENVGIPPGNDDAASGGRQSEEEGEVVVPGQVVDASAGPKSSDSDSWDANDPWDQDIIDASDRILSHFIEGGLGDLVPGPLVEPDPVGPPAREVDIDCVSEAGSCDSEGVSDAGSSDSEGDARLGWELDCQGIDWSDTSLGGWDFWEGRGVLILIRGVLILIRMLMMRSVGKVKIFPSWQMV